MHAPTHVLHREPSHGYPMIAGGEGVFLFDSDGKTYLDASGGAAVSCLGHGSQRVIESIKAQLDSIAFAHSGFFSNEPAERLGDFLSKRSPWESARVMFVSGGSEAIEGALKLARQIHVERGEPDRRHFIARSQSYHGATLGTLAVGGHMARRKPYEVLFNGGGVVGHAVSHIPPCYAYRHAQEGETDEAYGKRAAQALEEEILRVGSGNVAAFIAETVSGATLGAVPAASGYFKEIRRICDTYGVLLILDEVMCGCGRTGTLFASEQEGIVPDLIAVAKGLGGGYQPIGAVLVSEDLASVISEGSGSLEHGHTYMAHATACAAALAIQHVIEEDDLLNRVKVQGSLLREKLIQRFGQHAYIGDIRGRGLFIGLELVEDRETKTPFPAGARLAKKIKAAAMSHGLICYPGSGTADGKNGDHILLAPAYIIEDEQIDDLVDRLEKSLVDVFTSQ